MDLLSLALMQEAMNAAGSGSGAGTSNGITGIAIDGLTQPIVDGVVEIPLAGLQAGVVKSSDAENKIMVDADGTMEVASLNINKLVQSEDDILVLDGNY